MLLLGISSVLLVVAIVLGVIKLKEKIEEQNDMQFSSWSYESDSDNSSYSNTPDRDGITRLTDEQKELLDTKKCEECTDTEKAIVIQALSYKMDKNEELEYGEKLKTFYVDYLMSFDLSREDAEESYRMVRESTEK